MLFIMLHEKYGQHIRSDMMISFSRLIRAQNSTCMCHGSGAISSLLLLVILHGCRTSLRVLEQAATEQLNARRGAERALVEAKNRIALLDQALQQGGRPRTAAGQWWILVQLGRPDKWDGSEMAWPNWSFVMEAYAGAIDQDLSADMTTAECSTDAVSNNAMTGERKARSVQLCFVLIMLCTGRALDRIANAPHGWCMEALRLLFQAYSPKNNARLVMMMLEVLAFPSDTNDVMNSVETMERKFKAKRIWGGEGGIGRLCTPGPCLVVVCQPFMEFPSPWPARKHRVGAQLSRVHLPASDLCSETVNQRCSAPGLSQRVLNRRTKNHRSQTETIKREYRG